MHTVRCGQLRNLLKAPRGALEELQDRCKLLIHCDYVAIHRHLENGMVQSNREARRSGAGPAGRRSIEKVQVVLAGEKPVRADDRLAVGTHGEIVAARASIRLTVVIDNHGGWRRVILPSPRRANPHGDLCGSKTESAIALGCQRGDGAAVCADGDPASVAAFVAEFGCWRDRAPSASRLFVHIQQTSAEFIAGSRHNHGIASNGGGPAKV